MGQNWVQVRNAARDGTMRPGDPGVRDVVDRWEQFVEYLCLGLSQDLGVEVLSAQSRLKDGQTWTDELLKKIESEGVLSSSFKVPGAVGPIEVEADLRARLTRVSVKLSAPKEGRPLTRVNWMLRQLGKTPDDLRIEVRFARTKESTALLLRDAREEPKALLSPSDPKREPRSFTLSLARPLGTKRGKGERSFVLETRRQVVSFYGDLVEGLVDWRPKAPRLPSEKTSEEPGDPRHTLADGAGTSAPAQAEHQPEPERNLPVPQAPAPSWTPPTP
jgi:hypothetical protein